MGAASQGLLVERLLAASDGVGPAAAAFSSGLAPLSTAAKAGSTHPRWGTHAFQTPKRTAAWVKDSDQVWWFE